MSAPAPPRGAARRARSRRGRRGTLLGVLVGLGYVVPGIVIATAMAWPIFDTPRLAVVAAIAGVLGIAVVLVPRALRLPAWAVPPIAAVVYVLSVAPAAIPSALTGPGPLLQGVRDGVTGIVLGWKQLLTLELPLDDYQAVLVPFYLLVFLGTVVATALAVGATRWGALAVPVVVAMGLFGVVFGPVNAGSPLALGPLQVPDAREALLGLVLVLLSLAWLVVRARLARRGALAAARASTATVRQRGESAAIAVRRNLLAAVLLIGALLIGVLVAPGASELTPRRTLRDGVEPRLVVQAQPSPLSAYRGWFTATDFDDDLFTVDAPKGVDRIRIATLDTYDGETFTVAEQGDAGRFVRLPRTSASSGADEVRVTIGSGYRAIWMPVPDGIDAAPSFTGARAAVLADGFYLSQTDGTAIDVAAGSPRGLRPGDSYSVPAVAPSAAPLGDTDTRSTLDADQYPQLIDWVKRQGQGRDAAGFAELVDRLRARGYLSHALQDDAAAAKWIAALSSAAPYQFQSSYAGHSRSRIEDLFQQLVDQQKRAGDDAPAAALVAGIGDDEQFAVATALLARYYGYESRVVLGVRLTGGADSGVPACDTTCTGADMTAWTEVRAPGAAEWTAFDTTPQYRTAPTLLQEGEQLPKNPTVPDRPQADTADPPAAQRDANDAAQNRNREGASWWDAALPILRTAGLALLTLLLVLLPALVLLIAKGVRRRGRRAAPVPEVAVVGAWDELMDVYADYGIPQDGVTRLDAARASQRPFAESLATLADAAVFAEHPPTREAAEAGWEIVDAERRDLVRTRSFGRRLRAALTPVSFLRHLDPASALQALRAVFRRRELT
jgi:hypothetical protein